jgi:hypothetical protein
MFETLAARQPLPGALHRILYRGVYLVLNSAVFGKSTRQHFLPGAYCAAKTV